MIAFPGSTAYSLEAVQTRCLPRNPGAMQVYRLDGAQTVDARIATCVVWMRTATRVPVGLLRVLIVPATTVIVGLAHCPRGSPA